MKLKGIPGSQNNIGWEEVDFLVNSIHAMIVLKRKFLNFGQTWFSESDGVSGMLPNVDLIEYVQSPSPIRNAYQCFEFHTLVVDLRQEEEEIRRAIHKDTLYEIRRGVREQLVYVSWDTVDGPILSDFCDFYDEFAVQKKRGKIGRSLLMSYARQGSLHLSCVKTAEGRILTWHAHFTTPDRTRLLQSASHFRSSSQGSERALVGRANRFHHWEDMMHFRKKGATLYDFGGWYEGRTDTEKLKINHFKEEFGGVPAREYNGVRALSLRGKVYYHLKKWVGELMRR